MLFRHKNEAPEKKAESTRFNPAELPKEHLPPVSGEIAEGYTKHYLIPGKVFASAEPYAITTILGSGVSICLWDLSTGIGGANHFLMPEGQDSDADSTRYADPANERLLQELRSLGADLNKLQAKIFGGSQPSVTFGNTTECLGDRNVHVASRFLALHGIPIKQREVGGTRGRKLIFNTDDGHAWTQQL